MKAEARGASAAGAAVAAAYSARSGAALDAELGVGVTLYDLVAGDADVLAHTAGGVFEDERLNIMLRGLDPAEPLVVFAYAEGEGTTWTEAAAAPGAADPAALGECGGPCRVDVDARALSDHLAPGDVRSVSLSYSPFKICSVWTLGGV